MKRLIMTLVLTTLSCGVSQIAPTETVISAKPVQASATPAVENTKEVDVKFELTSPSFENGSPIPVDFSCKGRNVNPVLAWTEPPTGTKSFALIMDDPDAPSGIWVHWVIYDIPASARGLPEAVPADPALSDGSLQGVTSARSTGYHGPCPPSGTHRYFFKLFALDAILSLPDADGKRLVTAMEGHILGSAELMGTFSK